MRKSRIGFPERLTRRTYENHLAPRDKRTLADGHRRSPINRGDYFHCFEDQRRVGHLDEHRLRPELSAGISKYSRRGGVATGAQLLRLADGRDALDRAVHLRAQPALLSCGGES